MLHEICVSGTVEGPHSASFWKIIIQLTSHDDLFDRKISFFRPLSKTWQNVKLHFVIWQKNCLCLTLLDDQIFISF